MIIVLKQDAPKEKVHEFCTELEGMGLQINDCLLYTSDAADDVLRV